MRISDWSSDVCSSYLLKPSPSRGGFGWGWVSPTPPQIKSRRGRSPDLRQGFDGFAITQRDGVAVAVVAVDDHAVAADHHFAHQVAVAAEDPAVGDVFAGGAGEAGRGGGEQDVVVDVVESGRLRAARGPIGEAAWRESVGQ